MQAIAIELLVGDIISRHFCPEEERHSLLFSLVINETDLTFSSKINIFSQLLQLKYPDLLNRYPKVIDDLEKVRRFRNRIAHAMLDATEEFLGKKYEDRIQLVYYKGGEEKKQVVTEKEILERLKGCSQLVLALSDMQAEIERRVSK